MEAQAARFTCDTCGQLFEWKRELAGKKMKCVCGNVLMVPSHAEVDQDGLYELAEDLPPKRSPVAVVPRHDPLPAIASPRRVEPVEYAKPGSTAESPMDHYFPDRVKDFYIPLALIALGTLVRIIYAVVFTRFGRYSIPTALRELCLDLVVTTSLMLVAVLFTARVRQIKIGPLPVAILKICGVVIGAIGVTHLLGPLLMFIPLIGSLGMWVLQFAAVYTFLGVMFDMNESDCWFCVCVTFVVGVVVSLTYQGLRANGWF